MSTFSTVIARYEKATDKQFARMARQKRDFLTKNEKAAVRYYTAATIQTIALENQGRKDATEGS